MPNLTILTRVTTKPTPTHYIISTPNFPESAQFP